MPWKGIARARFGSVVVLPEADGEGEGDDFVFGVAVGLADGLADSDGLALGAGDGDGDFFEAACVATGREQAITAAHTETRVVLIFIVRIGSWMTVLSSRATLRNVRAWPDRRAAF
jgi:hypothetical protein